MPTYPALDSRTERLCYPIGFDAQTRNPAAELSNGPPILRNISATKGSQARMNSLISAVILSYAGLLVVGGVIGWRVSGSRISLTSSLISAALLAVAYRISLGSPFAGR